MVNIRNLRRLRVFSIFVIFFAGCRLILPISEPPVRTNEPIPTATNTIIPPTLTPSPTITHTLTTTFIPTITVQPTLNPTQKVLLVEELLKNNGDCIPPCLWGLTPGKTTFSEVDEFFQHMGSKGYIETNEKGEIIHYDTSFSTRDDGLPIEIVLEFKSEIIQNIRMIVGDLADPDVSRGVWSAYSLKNILQSYGIPSRVVFAIQQPTEPPFGTGFIAYSYVVHFEQTKVTYFYRGGPIKAGRYYKVCPISSKESATALILFFGDHPYGDFRNWVDLSEATSLNLEEFYNLFSEGDEQTCIDLDAKAFQ